MSAILYNYVCALCGTKFQASGVPEMSYGEFVLRTISGEEAYLEAITNEAFNEVARGVRAHPSLAGTDQSESGDVAQKVFGVACDLSPCGQRYYIDLNPICPNCSSQEMASWGELHPQQPSPIPSVTQTRWALMDGAEKADVINKAISDLS